MASLSSDVTSGFGDHCRQVVRDFLLTAVVVDDELSASTAPRVHGRLVPPHQRPSERAPAQAGPRNDGSWPLKVEPITWSFARQGLVCGVVTPREGPNEVEALADAVARADIVILDWRLSRTTGENALPLLEHILRADQPGRLRLIAFYTGEPDHSEIRRQITDSLDALDDPRRTARTTDDSHPIDFGACRIVVYGKPGSRTNRSNTVVDEEDLADRLIADVTEMVQGLLPSLVLTALAAVRENVYRVLDRFGPDLDPAFLAHRACLPQPSDSEQHMVGQIASELHGVMDDAVSRRRPAGIEAIEHWLTERFGDDHVMFDPNRQATVPEVLRMLTDGLEKEPPTCLLARKGRKKWDLVSHGLVGATGDGDELDHRFASAMSFRQVLEGDSRRLSMGTVVRRIGNGDTTLLLCVTPRCDSIRLTEKSSFLFLPLSEPPRGSTMQIVVPSDTDEHRRMTISESPAQWLMEDFTPDPIRQCVLAASDGSEREFTFQGCGGEYVWIGELKPEFAQSIAQTIAKRMSRLPLNKSEWLRRSERTG